MKHYEKKVANVDVGDLVKAKHQGCNMSAEEGIVIQNDKDLCVIDTCNSAHVYESHNGGVYAQLCEKPLCVYVFGQLEPDNRSSGVVVAKYT